MGFNNEIIENEAISSKTFFGLELGDGASYAIVVILALIFIRQISMVI